MSNVIYRPMNLAPPQKAQPPRPSIGAIAIEFCKRALAPGSVDTLYFLLTNDLRSIVPFDRCSMVVHLGGRSRLVAINNQPLLDKRAKFYDEMTGLSSRLRTMNNTLILPEDREAEQGVQAEADTETLEAVQSFMAFAESSSIAVVPILYGTQAAGHLILEFFEETRMDRGAIDLISKLAPFFGAALAEKWILRKRPQLKYYLDTKPRGTLLSTLRRPRYLVPAALVLTLVVLLIFVVPFSETVGGEAAIFPRDKHLAFTKIDGIIESMLVKEGDRVEQGQVIATLDPKDLDYKIRKAQTDFDLLTEQLVLLRGASSEDAAKLAESKLTELKRKSAWLELNYYKWQKQFLDIKSPVSGIVVTKEIETLKGKKVSTGEPFCELAVPQDLWVEVYVPEERIGNVREGQPLRLYLNNDPLKAYVLKVDEIAPAAEAHERLGNVYRVKGQFPGAENVALVGMKGIGKVDTADKTVWAIFFQRLAKLWNRLSLHF